MSVIGVCVVCLQAGNIAANLAKQRFDADAAAAAAERKAAYAARPQKNALEKAKVQL